MYVGMMKPGELWPKIRQKH